MGLSHKIRVWRDRDRLGKWGGFSLAIGATTAGRYCFPTREALDRFDKALRDDLGLTEVTYTTWPSPMEQDNAATPAELFEKISKPVRMFHIQTPAGNLTIDNRHQGRLMSVYASGGDHESVQKATGLQAIAKRHIEPAPWWAVGRAYPVIRDLPEKEHRENSLKVRLTWFGFLGGAVSGTIVGVLIRVLVPS